MCTFSIFTFYSFSNTIIITKFISFTESFLFDILYPVVLMLLLASHIYLTVNCPSHDSSIFECNARFAF